MRRGGVFLPTLHRSRDHPPHPSSVVSTIPLVAGDDMDMEMRDGLPCHLPDVDPNVIAIGMVAGIQELLCPVDNVQDRDLLIPGGLEIIGEMPFRDDQQVSPAHRVPIKPCIHKVMLDDHLLCINPAERTVHLHSTTNLSLFSEDRYARSEKIAMTGFNRYLSDPVLTTDFSTLKSRVSIRVSFGTSTNPRFSLSTPLGTVRG